MVVYKNKPNILSKDVASAQVLFGFIIFLFGGEFKPPPNTCDGGFLQK